MKIDPNGLLGWILTALSYFVLGGICVYTLFVMVLAAKQGNGMAVLTLFVIVLCAPIAWLSYVRESKNNG